MSYFYIHHEREGGHEHKKRTAKAQVQQSHWRPHGGELCAYRNQSYEAWLKKECDPIYKRLEALYPTEDSRNEAEANLSQALSAYQSVYTELGMKIGAKLVYQLLVSEE